MQYISREDYCEENCGKENREGYKTCKNCGMLSISTADVQPVKHGRWIDIKEDSRVSLCSECKHYGHRLFNFCANCGARMNKS